jgi:hypothetical protein
MAQLLATATYGLSELLDQSNVLSADTTLSESSADSGLDEVDQLLIAEVEQVLKVDAAVRELAESSLLLACWGLCASKQSSVIGTCNVAYRYRAAMGRWLMGATMYGSHAIHTAGVDMTDGGERGRGRSATPKAKRKGDVG